jgi:hypothetical protein
VEDGAFKRGDGSIVGGKDGAFGVKGEIADVECALEDVKE